MAKKQYSALLPQKTIKKIDNILCLDSNANSKNVAIEHAIDFYNGYLSTTNSQDFLMNNLVGAIQANMNSNTNKLLKLLYKNAVELNVLTRAVSSVLEIDRTQYDKMREAAIKDLKSSNGVIKLTDL